MGGLWLFTLFFVLAQVSIAYSKIVNDCMGFSIEYVNETMTVKGDFLKTSDIVKVLQNETLPKVINVYVISTFYVDCDLDLNGLEKLSVFAHTWDIQKATTFNLNGIDGTSTNKPPTTDGRPGAHGNPGTNAGHFIGYTYQSFNLDSLTVNMNGGRGENGQNGTSSKDVDINFKISSDTDTRVGFCWDVREYFERYFSGYDNREVLLTENYFKGYALVWTSGQKKLKFRLSSKCCGPTGKGGIGGSGGLAGKYIFMWDDKNVKNTPNVTASKGKDGQNGTDAKACKTTALDVLVDVRSHAYIVALVPMCTINTDFSTTKIANPKCLEEYVSDTQEFPKRQQRKKINLMASIVQYKRFLREKSQNPRFSKIIQETRNAIKLNQKLNDLYSMEKELLSL